MKIVGLITEYNPFHNGHHYHLHKALELTNSDAAIVVMSGNYVQRGTPSIMPKHLRTEIALKSGAAVVLELPVCYATGSAELFAMGAVSLLDRLGCVDSICFGTESDDFDSLKKAARILAEEPLEYQSALKNYLKVGNSFPVARQKALLEYTDDMALATCLNLPNNILGIEYLKALYRLNSHITPYAINRLESEYHDMELRTAYSSASAIRKSLENHEPFDNFSRLGNQVPPACLHLLKENYQIRYPVYANDFSLLLHNRLLSMTPEDFMEFVDVTPVLANRIFKNRNSFIDFDHFCDLIKTRDMTYTRISRALLHILLDIRKQYLNESMTNHWNGYAHILGFRKDCSAVLTSMKQQSSIPLLSKLSSVKDLEPFAAQMLIQDINASNLYESIITNKFKTSFINEYEHSIVRI